MNSSTEPNHPPEFRARLAAAGAEPESAEQQQQAPALEPQPQQQPEPQGAQGEPYTLAMPAPASLSEAGEWQPVLESFSAAVHADRLPAATAQHLADVFAHTRSS